MKERLGQIIMREGLGHSYYSQYSAIGRLSVDVSWKVSILALTSSNVFLNFWIEFLKNGLTISLSTRIFG